MLRSGPIYFPEASGATPKQQRFVKDLAMADLWIENDLNLRYDILRPSKYRLKKWYK